MSPEALEFLIVVLSGILIIICVWEVGKMMIKHFEDQREQRRADYQHQRWLREEVNKDN